LSRDDELLKELLQTFQAEAAEHLGNMNQTLLKLERQPAERTRVTLLQDAFRTAHSLKGAARAVGLEDIERIAHVMEDVLKRARDHKLQLDPGACDILYNALDFIQMMLDGKTPDIDPICQQIADLAAEPLPEPEPEPAARPAKTNGEIKPAPAAKAKAPPKPAPEPAPVQAVEPPAPEPEPEPVVQPAAVAHPVEPVHTPAPEQNRNHEKPQGGDPQHPLMSSESDETIRVSISKLDALMAQAGELLVAKIGAEQRVADMQDVRAQLAQWPKAWREIKALFPRVASSNDAGRQLVEMLNRHYDYLQNVTRQISVTEQDINRDTLRLGMVTGRLQDEVRRVRMVPFQTFESLLQRTLRDAARTENKQAVLLLEGGEVELDKKVLEALKDPLLHLLRNAVGHGLEMPDDRVKKGKPAEGKVGITVSQHGSEVWIIVHDDGHGFDLDGLRRAAKAAGMAEGDTSADDVIAYAFQPGITTNQKVTAISGRGVGLDVVRQQLENLQGRIVVKNNPGHGASFQLIVPVSLAMTRVLLVSTGPELYALPLASIEKIIGIRSTFSVEGQTMITVDGRPLPLISLGAALRRPAPMPKNPLAVIMGIAEQRLALLVDDVLTEQELAIKPLGKPLLRVPNVAGAAVLGNGEPIIILNAADLVKSSRSARGITILSQAEREQKPKYWILVVDDSITTRTLEKNILETAGYEVVTATDGREAVAQLKKNPISLVVSDVQMPNLDGIGLCTEIRGSSEYKEMPIILVTSLENPEDRERGMMAGANAYIVKRGFNQAELLATITQLL